ncbi:MAG: recombinase family protein [Myxococcaceae bacterium]
MKGKLKPAHLERRAYVYVRQSSAAQVLEHVESKKRQYGLVERAVALGWPRAGVEVVDEDQGKSGASTEGRTGFARLASAVAHGEVGAIFALEVSRLARSSEDWQRLLSLCAVAQVMVVDEQTIYDPGDRDDKLLLDLKGTMSEAELHWLGLRMVGARRSKAGRGELRIAAPTGYLWADRALQKDPNEAVRRAVGSVLARFEIEPSAWAVVRWARETGLTFPTRRSSAEDVEWKPLGVTRLIELLHNPAYAGTYAYGRRPVKKALVNGEIRRVRAGGANPDEWGVCIKGAHEGYISWETFLKNQEKLKRNLHRIKGVNPGAPREGRALLSGLILCGRCGRRMRTSYGRRGQPHWYYLCPGARDKGEALCWTISGESLDEAVEGLFLETMVPSELELSLAVEREVDGQAAELEKQWRARIEQAGYEARRAERRYKAVDPDNRVVARTLEREWEQRLQQLEEVERRYSDARRSRQVELAEGDRQRIRQLAKDLPAVWNAASTKPADKKAMLRLVVEAVSLTPIDVPRRGTRIRVQWQSGVVSELEVDRPTIRDRLRTSDEVVERIRSMASDGLRDEQMAQRLNAAGVRTAARESWNVASVRWVRRRNGIVLVAPDAPRSRPLPERHPDGRYSVAGVAKHFDVSPAVVHGWLARGLVHGRREDFDNRHGVYWLDITDNAAERLKALAAKKHTQEVSQKHVEEEQDAL